MKGLDMKCVNGGPGEFIWRGFSYCESCLETAESLDIERTTTPEQEHHIVFELSEPTNWWDPDLLTRLKSLGIADEVVERVIDHVNALKRRHPTWKTPRGAEALAIP